MLLAARFGIDGFRQIIRVASTRRLCVCPRGKQPFHTINEESFERHRPGGYYPVRIGDIYHSGEYRIIRKLGCGVYATVWLAANVSYAPQQSPGHELLWRALETRGQGPNS